MVDSFMHVLLNNVTRNSVLNKTGIDDNYPDSVENYKRMKLNLENELKIYPNFDLFSFDDEQKLVATFTRYCPLQFKICSVVFEKHRSIPACRLSVEYEADGGYLSEQGDELKMLVSMLLKHVPINCYIMNRVLIERKK
ncbi:hypothetical protein QE152_g8536 [Popillia japonica]|uniref:Uncharacterized protein n=1 Tax=Popillia japonica TaxID=7064 RepID=A0AAW1M2P2_POPJA